MKLRNSILFILLALLMGMNLSEVQAQQPSKHGKSSTTVQKDNIIYHTVEVGETAYSISKAHDISLSTLYKYNPGAEKGVRLGQALMIVKPSVIEKITIKDADYTPYGDTPTQRAESKQHTIQAKETLFSVSQQYGITIPELLQANEELSAETFKIGRVIAIPSTNQTTALKNFIDEGPKPSKSSTKGIEHKVTKQETLYSISKQYACSIDDIHRLNPQIATEGLKEGTVILIPYIDSDSHADYSTLLPGQFPTFYSPNDGVARIGVLLPFLSGSKTVSSDKITEYYEGLLLAIQQMKSWGLNAEIYTFDIGKDSDSNRLDNILSTSELNSLDLIIGGITDKQIRQISNFSRRTGVKYVVPFTNKDTGIEYNPYLFQVANSHSNLFKHISRAFIQKYKNSNIIFLTEAGSSKDKQDFTKALQKELKEANIPYREAPTSLSVIKDLETTVDPSRSNIVIPTSSSESSLRRALEGIQYLSKKGCDISLFGYPEWQTYHSLEQSLHQTNTTIYSMFYLDNKSAAANRFSADYKKWYNKRFIASTPKYAHMGYDTGLFFLTAVSNYGGDFPLNIEKVNVPTLQSALYFKRISGKGGFINSGFYLINFKPNGSVIRTEIK